MKINYLQLAIVIVWYFILRTQYDLFASTVGLIAFILIGSLFGNHIIIKEKDEEDDVKAHQEKAEQVIKFGVNEVYNRHSNKRYSTKSKRLKGGR